MSPLLGLALWGQEHFRLFDLYYFIPSTAFGFFYSVYLVQRFGGTPGKRLMRVSIVKVSGEPVTYREACLRYFPEWILGIATSIALMIAAFQLTDSQYFSATSLMERTKLITSSAPSWYGPIQFVLNIWVWSELVVMLTNKKRRAIHDFIAGTVVIEDAQLAAPWDAPQAARP